MARMNAVSSTVVWLRSRATPPANTSRLITTMAKLAFVFLYMLSIHASMTRPMVPPMVSAMKTRLWLKRTWSSSQALTNIVQYMTTMAVRIIAPNRRYIPMPRDPCSSPSCSSVVVSGSCSMDRSLLGRRGGACVC
jgi:hypothetical protein